MLGETYQLHEFENATVFWFISTGDKGEITKVILLTPKSGNTWNLGFGDYHEGTVHDGIISNNRDLRKVMSTVARACYEFFRLHPNQIISIQPVDHRRRNLYNLIFQKRWHEISPNFKVVGWIADRKEIALIKSTMPLKLNPKSANFDLKSY